MPGRIAQPRLTYQTVMAAVLSVVLAVALVRVWAGPRAGAGEMVLSGLRDVTVTAPGGAVRLPGDGDRVAPGETVHTRPGGSATITVDGRRVLLDSATAVVVHGPREFTLRTGGVLVDRRRGPDLHLDAGSFALAELTRGLARVERGYAVRVSVYAGEATVRGATGRELRVPALHVAAAAGRALPDAPAPLTLTGHRWEAEAAPDVVDADRVLVRLALGVDGPSLAPRARVVTASTAAAPTGPPSEAVLPIAIGRAARAGDVDRARALRGAGGSWGVVAALVSADVADVASTLDALLSGGLVPGPGGSAGPDGPGGPDGGSVAGPSPGVGPEPSRGGSSRSPSPTPSRTPSPGPSPSPSPSSDPVAELVEDAIEMVPTPSLPPPLDPPLNLLG